MQITWHGQYTIKITSKDDVLVIDPYSPETGLAPFRAKATLVALSNPQEKTMSHVSGVQGEYRLINTPGEYSISGFTLHALGWENAAGLEQNIQLWNIEDVAILHVGALTRDLTDKELQELERMGIDVLIVPVGGGSSLNVSQAMNLVTTIEPRMIIPIHYKLPHLNEKLDPVDVFTKELGVSTKPEAKLLLKAKNLPQEEMQTIILQP
ncbi:MAG: MBL fold metallo-hydrolase [Candidatus Andersenbacteria bacterium]|nr:MBL fold metallo-hydrolase [Candidatus Andersenbacteria bacterium]